LVNSQQLNSSQQLSLASFGRFFVGFLYGSLRWALVKLEKSDGADMFQLHQEFELEKISRAGDEDCKVINVSHLFARAKIAETKDRLEVLAKHFDGDFSVYYEGGESITLEDALQGLKYVLETEVKDVETLAAVWFQGLEVLFALQNYFEGEKVPP
jgi:hypothetical protein